MNPLPERVVFEFEKIEFFSCLQLDRATCNGRYNPNKSNLSIFSTDHCSWAVFYGSCYTFEFTLPITNWGIFGFYEFINLKKIKNNNPDVLGLRSFLTGFGGLMS